MSGGVKSMMGSLFPSGSSSLTVLSIDAHWLKFVHAKGPWGSRTITAVLARQIDGLSDSDIIVWLQQACAERQLEPGPVLLANPSQLTTARLFTLPSTDSREIRDIVELQAEKHTPYAKEEILTDFQVLDTDRNGYSRVLLILSHQDIVYRGLKLLDGLGWPLERTGFELEGLVNWFHLAQPKAQGVTLVAEVDSETTSLAILVEGKPYFHRTLSCGAVQLQEGEPGIARLIAEFQRSLETFDAEGLNLTAAGVVVTGQASRFPDLQPRLHASLGLPVTVLPQFEQCPVADGALKDDPALATVGFASLAGLALRPSAIDLTPKALKLHRAFDVRARRLVGVGCQMVVLLLLASCLVVGRAIKNERHQSWLKNQYQATAEEADTLRQLLDRIEFTQGWLRNRGKLLNALAELSRNTPSAIQWDSLTFSKDDKEVILKGVSEEIPKVYDYTRELKQSPLFAQVEVRRAAKRKVNDRDVTEFEITCSLRGPEEEAERSETLGTSRLASSRYGGG
jgi:Tfp pilus assembly PilM family ATPase